MPETILVVDDKASVRLLLDEYLTEQGFRVVTAHNGRDALFTARYEKPDLILLDIMMPEMDGYAFITAHRREQETPIILITARQDESDTVLGLELGADDYITKPFRMRELVARVRAVLRRVGKETAPTQRIQIDNVAIDQSAHTVTVQGQPISVTPTEFDLLSILMSAPGHVFSRSSLLEKLERNGFNGLERSINVHIRNLRTKIESDPSNPYYIETVFGVGYRFVSPLE